MKQFLDKFSKHIALLIVVVSGVIISYIIYELAATKRAIGEQMVDKVTERTHHELQSFFDPVKSMLTSISNQAHMQGYQHMNRDDINRLFLPVIESFSQISSMGIADDRGFEYDLIRDTIEERWLARYLNPTDASDKEKWFGFRLDSELKKQVDSTWYGNVFEDPRSRPWFTGAIQKRGEVFWSAPYQFNSTGISGMTVSASWKETQPDTMRIIMAFDLTLEDISRFSQNIKPTANGEVMIVSGDGKSVVGYPQETPPFPIRHGFKGLFPVESLQHPELSYIIHEGAEDQVITFAINGQKWWGAKQKFFLDHDEYLYIVIALPESDFLQELNESQRLIAGGFFGILLLTVLILRSHNRQIRQRKLLAIQNEEISAQKDIIAAKNEEIVESIQYARNIQQAILPPARLVHTYLEKSFIFYLPKDIVAGDFYWMERRNNKIFFAAADCTGHGVPGAMVSVMCHNALNRSTREFNLTDAGAILDNTRQLVIEEFSKSEQQMKDGMDISLCAIDIHTLDLSWAGANNPLWVIRDGELMETKADKQPVGNHISMRPFTSHQISLQKGDRIYVFTDGIQDQFGGPKGKKFKVAQLRSLILSLQEKPISAHHQFIMEAFQSWKGELEQVDDVCMIGVEI